MSEHSATVTPPSVHDTFRASQQLLREWGVDSGYTNEVDETVRIDTPEIRSKNMGWYPGKAAVASEVEIAPSEFVPAVVGLTDRPVHADSSAQDPVSHHVDSSRRHETEPHVIKRDSDGNLVAIPYKDYLEQKTERKAAEAAYTIDQGDDNTHVTENSLDRSDDSEAEQERIKAESEQAAHEVESKRAKIDSEIAWLRAGLDSIMQNVPEEYRTAFHWAGVHYGNAVSAGEDREKSQMHLNSYYRELKSLPAVYTGKDLHAYADLMRQQSSYMAQLRELEIAQQDF